MKNKGKLITLEGMDGSGKTTMTGVLVGELKALGYDVVRTREPGGTPLAEKIRAMIFDNDQCALTELLLFNAARAQHLNEVIIPAINEGKIVVCDRFTDSSFAYQGFGRGLQQEAEALEAIVLNGFEIDYTLYFSIPLEVSIERLNSRLEESNRLDTEKLEFKKRIYAGYEYRRNAFSGRMYGIDANQPIENVREKVRDWVNVVFHRNNKDLLGQS